MITCLHYRTKSIHALAERARAHRSQQTGCTQKTKGDGTVTINQQHGQGYDGGHTIYFLTMTKTVNISIQFFMFVQYFVLRFLH